MARGWFPLPLLISLPINNNNLRPQEYRYVFFRPEKSPLMLNFVNVHTVKQLSVRFDLAHFFPGTTQVDLFSNAIFALPNCLNL